MSTLTTDRDDAGTPGWRERLEAFAEHHDPGDDLPCAFDADHKPHHLAMADLRAALAASSLDDGPDDLESFIAGESARNPAFAAAYDQAGKRAAVERREATERARLRLHLGVGGWVHEDGSECPSHRNTPDGRTPWCTEHEQRVSFPSAEAALAWRIEELALTEFNDAIPAHQIEDFASNLAAALAPLLGSLGETP